MYSFFRSPVAWVLVVVVALACGTGYWVVDQRLERERVEREQAESDRQEQQRFAASETRRKRDQQLMQDELRQNGMTTRNNGDSISNSARQS